VTDHLKPWHKFCDENYLLDWKPIYDVAQNLKQIRTCTGHIDLPSWAMLLNDPAQQRVKARMKGSLADALEADELKELDGQEYKSKGKIASGWSCGPFRSPSCPETYLTTEEFMYHLRDAHKFPDEILTRCVTDVDVSKRDWKELKGNESSWIEVPTSNKKRFLIFLEENNLEEGSTDASSDCVQGPFKRPRV